MALTVILLGTRLEALREAKRRGIPLGITYCLNEHGPAAHRRVMATIPDRYKVEVAAWSKAPGYILPAGSLLYWEAPTEAIALGAAGHPATKPPDDVA
jgi:hypothetical protein